jgi:hypothetical protein
MMRVFIYPSHTFFRTDKGISTPLFHMVRSNITLYLYCFLFLVQVIFWVAYPLSLQVLSPLYCFGTGGAIWDERGHLSPPF